MIYRSWMVFLDKAAAEIRPGKRGSPYSPFIYSEDSVL